MINSMDIFTYFKNKGIDTLDSNFYKQIEVWRSWYNSNVRKFHKYRVYRGNGTSVNCTRYSLGMAKKVCEDMADLLLNEGNSGKAMYTFNGLSSHIPKSPNCHLHNLRICCPFF